MAKNDRKWPARIVEIPPEREDARNADPQATKEISKAELAEALARVKSPERRTTSGVRTKAVRPSSGLDAPQEPAHASQDAPASPPPASLSTPMLTPRLLLATLLVGLALGILAAYAAGLVH